MNREESINLLSEYIKSESLINHSKMVAKAMEGYATKLGLDSDQVEIWWHAGLLHDLDWEKYPDEHPNYAINNIFPKYNYPQEMIEAIKAHAPDRTGKTAETTIERYLFACDELSGFINAVSLIRPTGLKDIEVSSVTKRLKDKRFAANVSREDIQKGCELIGISINEHVANLISFFK